MKVVCCQTDIAWENKTSNHTKVKALLAHTAIPKGSLVLLSEMFSTGFSMNVAAIAEGDEAASEKFLANLAREFEVYLLGGVVTATVDGRGRNEALVFSPKGKEIARYCKMQPFTRGGESANYVAGAKSVFFSCGEVLVSPFICYDLRFPELFRVAAWRKPHLITVIASWPDIRLHHWVKLLVARAIENQAYVAGVNRIGKDPQHSYSGRSLIVNPHGEIIADAGDRECVISADLDLDGLLAYRRDFPALPDMRADFVRRAE